jgi:hypothetical protein
LRRLSDIFTRKTRPRRRPREPVDNGQVAVVHRLRRPPIQDALPRFAGTELSRRDHPLDGNMHRHS